MSILINKLIALTQLANLSVTSYEIGTRPYKYSSTPLPTSHPLSLSILTRLMRKPGRPWDGCSRKEVALVTSIRVQLVLFPRSSGHLSHLPAKKKMKMSLKRRKRVTVVLLPPQVRVVPHGGPRQHLKDTGRMQDVLIQRSWTELRVRQTIAETFATKLDRRS